jgi:hypothetical protein
MTLIGGLIIFFFLLRFYSSFLWLSPSLMGAARTCPVSVQQKLSLIRLFSPRYNITRTPAPSKTKHPANPNQLTMNVLLPMSPPDNGEEILAAPGLLLEESSPGPSGGSAGSRRVTSIAFTPGSGLSAIEAMEPPPEIHRSPHKHSRSEQEVEEAGYDSDDGPCFDAIDNEGVQDLDEDDEIASSAPAATVANQQMTVQSVLGQIIDIEELVLKKIKVNELKQALLVSDKMERLTPKKVL